MYCLNMATWTKRFVRSKHDHSEMFETILSNLNVRSDQNLLGMFKVDFCIDADYFRYQIRLNFSSFDFSQSIKKNRFKLFIIFPYHHIYAEQHNKLTFNNRVLVYWIKVLYNMSSYACCIQFSTYYIGMTTRHTNKTLLYTWE